MHVPRICLISHFATSRSPLRHLLMILTASQATSWLARSGTSIAAQRAVKMLT